MKKKSVITIDGPAGSGKSTIARKVARELGYVYVDTGALYRALTWKALKENLNLHDESILTDLARRTKMIFKDGRLWMDGSLAPQEIRSEKVSRHINEIAKVKGVRKILNQTQRRMGERGHIVMEGRDIGTRIFPQAKFKFYLDASPLERAKRRYLEQKARGQRTSLKKIAHALAQRDYKDKTRGISPLRQAADATVIDSTHLSLAQVARRIVNKVNSESDMQ